MDIFWEPSNHNMYSGDTVPPAPPTRFPLPPGFQVKQNDSKSLALVQKGGARSEPLLTLADVRPDIRGRDELAAPEDELQRDISELKQRLALREQELQQRDELKKRQQRKVVMTVAELKKLLASARDEGFKRGHKVGFAAAIKLHQEDDMNKMVVKSSSPQGRKVRSLTQDLFAVPADVEKTNKAMDDLYADFENTSLVSQ